MAVFITTDKRRYTVNRYGDYHLKTDNQQSLHTT